MNAAALFTIALVVIFLAVCIAGGISLLKEWIENDNDGAVEGRTSSLSDNYCPCCNSYTCTTPMFCHHSMLMSMEVGAVDVWKMLQVRDIEPCSHTEITYSNECDACRFMEEMIEDGQCSFVKGSDNCYRNEACCDYCTYPQRGYFKSGMSVCRACTWVAKCEHKHSDFYENDQSGTKFFFCLDCGLDQNSILW